MCPSSIPWLVYSESIDSVTKLLHILSVTVIHLAMYNNDIGKEVEIDILPDQYSDILLGGA